MKLIEKIIAIILLLRNCERSVQDVLYQDSSSEVHRKHQSYEIRNEPSDYRRFNSNSNERGSCKCSCKKCNYKPRRCCKRICNRCRAQPQPAQFYQAPSSLVMIPFPVPFIVYPIKNSTQSNQTTTTTTTTIKPVENSKSKEDPIPGGPIVFLRLPFTSSTTYFLGPRSLKGQKLKAMNNHGCPYMAECSYNYVDYDDYVNYSNRRAKLDEKHRKLEIMQSIRPTVGVKNRITRATPMRELPRYGLVKLPEDMSKKLMMQLKKT